MAASITKFGLQKQISVARNELKNIRQQIEGLKHVHKKEVQKINSVLYRSAHADASSQPSLVPPSRPSQASTKEEMASEGNGNLGFKPIGYIQSPFNFKYGTPRQPSVCASSRAKITLNKGFFSNPAMAFIGLEQYSHVWIMFHFHQNKAQHSGKAKVTPPRLDGSKVGVFASRSPHRPNPIGLTLSKIEEIKGNTIYLSGVDMVDGTPVLDIKPYIPSYDCACIHNETLSLSHQKEEVEEDTEAGGQSALLDQSMDTDSKLPESVTDPGEGADKSLKPTHDAVQDPAHSKKTVLYSVSRKRMKHLSGKTEVELPCNRDLDPVSRPNSVSIASWVDQPPVKKLSVRFTQNARQQLSHFRARKESQEMEKNEKISADYFLDYLNNLNEAEQAIISILEEDPRSLYQRTKCLDKLYHFTLDSMHITTWFDESVVEVVRVLPLSHVKIPKPKKQ